MNSSTFSQARLIDLISRVVPSAFFLFVVMLKFAELYALLLNHHESGQPASLKFTVDAVSRTSTVSFLALMTLLFFIRLEPVGKAKHLLPRVMAIVGTFLVAMLTLFPRAELSLTQSLLATAVSVF